MISVGESQTLDYKTAFNSLYMFWRRIHDITNVRMSTEGRWLKRVEEKVSVVVRKCCWQVWWKLPSPFGIHSVNRTNGMTNCAHRFRVLSLHAAKSHYNEHLSVCILCCEI